MRDFDRRVARAAHNLPSRLSSFVGREREIDEVVTLLGAHRLVTLVGAPGVGKSRLSLQVASAVLERFPDGVWLIELAPLADPVLAPLAVAHVLGLSEQPGRPLAETLVGYLRTRRLLFLLDNCEHLIGAAAKLAETLLQACPGLRVLASSREPLAIDGEVPYRVPSLSVPEATHIGSVGAKTAPGPTSATTPAAVADFEAVRLFVERARVASPTFRLHERNAALVVQICARLDGIPLAIELAAARVRSLSVEEIAARLDDRFRLLTGGSRTALPRQRTLRGAVDWSYDLLSEREQILLRRLSVFAGGFTLDAVDGVVSCELRVTSGGSPHAPLATRYSLLDLVDKSLVQVDERADGDVRYRLLETFREYGQEKLAEHGELAAVRDRHRDYWLGVAEAAQPRLEGAGQLAMLSHLDREHDNLRAALAWCVEAADGRRTEPGPDGHPPSRTPAEIGIQLAGALWRFWWLRGHIGEGRRWFDRVLELPSRTDSAPSERSYRARAHFGAGNLMGLQFEVHAATQHLEIALALSRAAGDDRGVSQALRSLAPARAYAGDHDLAHRLCEESVAIARQTGDPYTLAMALLGSSRVYRFLDEHDRSIVVCDEGLELLRGLGDVVITAHMLCNVAGAVYTRLADPVRAQELAEEALRLSRDLGDKRGQGDALQLLGHFALRSGDLTTALSMIRSAVAVLQETGQPGMLLWACFRLAQVRTEQGVRDQAAGRPLLTRATEQFQEATRLFSAVDAVRRQLRLGPLDQMDRVVKPLLPIVRQHLGEPAFAQAWAEGQAMTFEQMATYALEITGAAISQAPDQSAETRAYSSDPALAQLTPRELEVAALVARGLGNRQIAAQLTVTRRTAETHVHNILSKLELASRGELAFWGVQHGLIPAGGQ